MRPGKISQAVYERSVYRPLKAAGVLPDRQAFGQDRFRGMPAVRSTASGAVDGFCMPRAEMLLAETLNRLGLVSGFSALRISAILPSDFEETELKRLAVRLGEEAKKAGAVIEDFSASVSFAVSEVVLSVSASGEDAGSKLPGNGERETMSLGAAEKKTDLVMAGTCGMAGTAVLALSFRERLGKRFPERFLRAAEDMADRLSIWKAMEEFHNNNGVNAGEYAAMQAVAEGGVFAALWELCQRLDCGLDADIHRIPIRQETVEICEYLNRNPYRLYGTGTVLIAAEDGKTAVRHFREAGIGAEVIGKLTEGPGRYIHNRQVTRCLEKPLPDALFMEG